jgi:MFS family permease
MLITLVLTGLASGVGVTTWQSIQPLLVPRELIASAVRMNSTQYAISRAIGPALGTLVLREWGAATCFISNAIGFLFVVVAMMVVQTREQPVTERGPGMRAELRDGWDYLRSDASLRFPPIGILFLASLGVTWTALAAAIAAEHYGHASTDGGLLVTSYGVGSVLTGLLAGRLTLGHPRSRIAVGAFLMASAGLAVVASTHSFAIGLAGMFLLGIGHLLTSVVLNTAIQLHSHDRLRGRVMGIYLQCSLIGHATGSLLNAKVVDATSIRTTMLIDAALLLLPLLIGLRGGLRALDSDRVVPPLDAPEPVLPAVGPAEAPLRAPVVTTATAAASAPADQDASSAPPP